MSVHSMQHICPFPNAPSFSKLSLYPSLSLSLSLSLGVEQEEEEEEAAAAKQDTNPKPWNSLLSLLNPEKTHIFFF